MLAPRTMIQDVFADSGIFPGTTHEYKVYVSSGVSED